MKITEKNGSLSIADFDEVDAYKIACRIEKDGIGFYSRLSQGQKDKKAKEAIDFLITEEQKHLNLFEKFVADVRARLDKEKNENEDLLASIDYGIFWPYQNMKNLDELMQDVRLAFKLAVLVEDKSISFYKLCAEQVSVPDVKAELLKIVEEEDKHKKLFMKLLDKCDGKK